MFITSCNTSDFNPQDFDHLDFSVGSATNYFYQFFKEILPPYYRKNDTFIDAEGDGLLVRYLTIFGDEIDQNIIPQLECYLNIIDAQLSGEEYLIHLSDVLGNPPDIFGNEEMYRNLLSYITSVYKIKGTKKAYELFFSLLGFSIDLIEIPPNDEQNIYDTEQQYDTGKFYDQYRCEPCSYYDIIFYPYDEQLMSITPDIVNRLRDAIAFNEPINAKLRNLIFKANLSDSIGVTLGDNATEEIGIVNLYDIGNSYDDNLPYDN